MSGFKFLGAGLVASLLVLSSHEPMAQGLLPMPQPSDGIMSPDPLGPLQKFGDRSPGGEPRFTKPERAPLPHPQQAQSAPSGQSLTQRRPNLASKPRQIAVRSFVRQHDWQRGVIGSGSALALAPTNQARLPSRRFCFPSSTIHLQQNERDNCNGGAPAVKARFEELLSK
jgi:hypothetical protein